MELRSISNLHRYRRRQRTRSRFSFFLPPRTTVRSEDLFHPEHDLVSLRPISGAKLVIAVCIEKPFTRVPYHARTYRPYLLRRVRERNTIDAAIRNLPEVVGVGANPKVFAKVVRGSGVEMNRLSCLRRLSASCGWRTIIRRIS